MGSTLVQTAINGGNLEDNLKVALLSGLAGALQGELASQIGTSLDKVDPSVLEYTIHKIAHAAAGCATAAIVDKSNCEAGAIGAGVGEIVAGLMIPEGKTALDLTDDERKSIINTSKIIVGTTAAYAGYDVITAANSADIAIENNSLPKLATTVGKAAYKVAQEISKMPAAARANLKPSEIAEMLRKEGVQGIIDIGDNINTLISPASSPVDRAFALIDLAIGFDLKAGKNVDSLKNDRLIIRKNISDNTEMLGAKGVQMSSNTVWRIKGTKARIDVENPAPGKRAGQIHYQDINNEKYLYDPKSNKFYVEFDRTREAPKSIQALLDNPSFKAGIDKAKKYLGEV